MCQYVSLSGALVGLARRGQAGPGGAEATGQKRFFPHLLKLNPSVTSLQTVFLGEESIDTFIPLSVK